MVEGDGEWLSVRAAHGLTMDQVMVRLKVGSPVSGLAVSLHKAIVCPDVAQGIEYAPGAPRVVELQELASHIVAHKIVDEFDTDEDLQRMQGLAKRYRAMLSVPLVVRHIAYGALTLFYPEPRDVSEEEIGLALTFGGQAALIVDNARLHGRAEDRLRELEALYRADEILHRSLRVADVLRALVDVAADVLQADKSAMMIWDERHERLIVGAIRGFRPESIPLITRASTGLAARVATTGQPLVIEDAQADTRVAHEITDAEGIRSFVHVPIKIGDEIFGVFTLNYTQLRSISGNELRLLLSLAQRAALAIQNARLYEQAEQAAVLEERQRLARELHDAVTQTLFSASLIAEVLPRLAASGDQLEPRLEELRRLNRGALAEMRALLLELRPSTLSEVPLGDLLGQLVEAANARSTLEYELRIEGEPFALAAEAQVTLYRLVQEALNNVGKHAQAQRAEVVLGWGETSLSVVVHDDGIGFDTDEVPAGHLGLDFMAERAAAIDAELSITSRPGEGTTVQISLPRA